MTSFKRHARRFLSGVVEIYDPPTSTTSQCLNRFQLFPSNRACATENALCCCCCASKSITILLIWWKIHIFGLLSFIWEDCFYPTFTMRWRLVNGGLTISASKHVSVKCCCVLAGRSCGIREGQRLYGVLHVFCGPGLPHGASSGRWVSHLNWEPK